MKLLIKGKIRDTKKLEQVCGYEGNPNDCYSTYNRLMYDVRDGCWFDWSGHFWSGLGPDTLTSVQFPTQWIEERGIDLSEKEVARLPELKLVE